MFNGIHSLNIEIGKENIIKGLISAEGEVISIQNVLL